jgi:hypothetical protein
MAKHEAARPTGTLVPLGKATPRDLFSQAFLSDSFWAQEKRGQSRVRGGVDVVLRYGGAELGRLGRGTMTQKLFIRSMHKWRLVGGTMVTFTTQGPINNDVWSAYHKELREKDVTGWLSTTVGYVEATGVQRKISTDITTAKKIPVAVVTDDRIVRGMVTAASWLGVKIQSFSFDELEAAIEYLGASVLAPRIVHVVNELKLSCEEDFAPPMVARRR